MPQKTLVAFGNFDLEGGRSWVIRTGLEEHGYRIVLCRTETQGLIGKWRDLRRKWKTTEGQTDAIYVPFLGHYVLPLAWRLAKRKRIPVIFDAFLSLYDTEVCDRKRLSRLHPKAWLLWALDWLCCRLADVVLLDTEEHKRYFVERYGVPAPKILVVPVGCRTDLFGPSAPRPDRPSFIVHFHGTYVPLQGVDVILRAAKILQDSSPDVRIRLVGKGQTWEAMQDLAGSLELRNVDFLDPVPLRTLPRLLAEADVCLGIFGTSAKAGRVIPNKAYEILGAGRPLLTARTPASMRVLRDGVDALLCNPGDPADLAAKIEELRANPELRRKISEGGRRLMEERFLPKQIVGPLIEWLDARF